jgi:branched-chain amino acid transport system permease protein
MRAVAQDRDAAALMGVNMDRVVSFTFVIGSALAGVAAILWTLNYSFNQTVGALVGLKAFTAAVIGGIGNMPGAALGGLFIGFLSAWSDQYISARWTNAIVFSILILVLVFRPHGLLGERTAEKL